MRISDWSSDVCASDLHKREEAIAALDGLQRQRHQAESQYLKDVLTQRRDSEQKVAALEEDLLKAEQKRGQQTLLSPIDGRSEEHTSELQSLMRISYAVFCLKKKITQRHNIDAS